MDNKELNAFMYRNYGISEWHEKCLVLSEQDQNVILTNLEEGRNSQIVALAKLPYPLFVKVYLSKFPAAEHYLQDPAFGYKLYLMSEQTVKILCETIRIPDIKTDELKRKHGRSQVDKVELSEFMNTPLDIIPKVLASDSRAKTMMMKYLYLTQYIDYAEAKRLGLGIVTLLDKERDAGATANGFELEEKLKTLNSAARLIIVKLLGLYGHQRLSIKEISKELGISAERIYALYDELISVLPMTLGDFKNKIGYIKKDYAPGETIEYTSRGFRTLDLDIQIKFILKNLIGDAEKLILSSYSNKEVAAYIAYKYIYPNDKKKVSEYLAMSIVEIENFGSKGGLK